MVEILPYVAPQLLNKSLKHLKIWTKYQIHKIWTLLQTFSNHASIWYKCSCLEAIVNERMNYPLMQKNYELNSIPSIITSNCFECLEENSPRSPVDVSTSYSDYKFLHPTDL